MNLDQVEKMVCDCKKYDKVVKLNSKAKKTFKKKLAEKLIFLF